MSHFPHNQSGTEREHLCPPMPHHDLLRIEYAKDIGYYIARYWGAFKVQIEFCPFCGTHLPRPYDEPGREQEMQEARAEWER